MLKIPDLIRTFQSIGSVSGNETSLAECISELARPYADEISSDRLGNLIVRKKGTGAKVMLYAHMDTPGLLATHIDDKGFVRFAAIGKLSPCNLSGAAVVFENGTRGVVSFEEKTNLEDLMLSHGYVDIGADSHGQAATLVGIGERARYDAVSFEANGKVIAPYLDAYAGCSVLLKTLAGLDRADNDLYFVFAAQEEAGQRGAGPAAFAIDPDWALAVGTSPSSDVPEPKRKTASRLGAGPSIRLMDTSFVCHPDVVKRLEHSARTADILCQTEILDSGFTGAGPVSLSRSGVPTGLLSIPVRYLRTPAEMAALSDMEACAALLHTTLKNGFPTL